MVSIVVGRGGGAHTWNGGRECQNTLSLKTRIYDKGYISESGREGFLQQFVLCFCMDDIS